MVEIENQSADTSIQKVDFVIITTLPEERDSVLRKLPSYKLLDPISDDIRTYYSDDVNFTFPSGAKGTYHLIVMPLLGMGRLEAAAATGDAIRRWHPHYVILVGIAGGIAEEGVNLGDILISDQIVDYELQKLTSNGPEIRWRVHQADRRLFGAASNLEERSWGVYLDIQRPTLGTAKTHFGPIASGDKVIAFCEALIRYRDVWPKLIGVEMEAAGVATAAFEAADRPGFFMVRGVSDLADEAKNSDEVQRWRGYACDIAAAYLLTLLKAGRILPLEMNDQHSYLTKKLSNSSYFVYGRPVQPDEFIDRKDDINTVVSRVCNGESTAIVGEPHIGKSSFLLQLADKVANLRKLRGDTQEFIIAKLDLHFMGNNSTPIDFWKKALEPLRKLSNQGDHQIAWRLEQLARDDYLGDSLVELFEYLRNLNQHLVILIDEFDQLLNIPQFQNFSFYATLRSVANTTGLVIVLTSRYSLEEIEMRVRGFPIEGGSAPFNYMIEVRLGPFDEKAIHELFDRAGDALSSRDRFFIRYMAGRHPYLLQAMARALLETTHENRDECAAKLYHDQTCRHFDELWRTLDNRRRTTVIVLGTVEIARCKMGGDFDYSEIQALSSLETRLLDLFQQGLAEYSNSDVLPYPRGFFYMGRFWFLGARAFTCWICQVAVKQSRQVASYDEWLNGEGYRFILSPEQWKHLIGGVRHTLENHICDIGFAAVENFKEVTRRREDGNNPVR